MNITNLFMESVGFFDGLIVLLFAFNLILLWGKGRAVFSIPPYHAERISTVILELFPVLGILGTVWGLSHALLTISQSTGGNLELGLVTRQFGGAMSSTFLGLAAVGLTLGIAAFLAVVRDERGH